MQVGADVILLVAVVLVCSTAPMTHVPMRVALHVAVIGAGGVAALATGLSAATTVTVIAVVATAAVVASSFAAELRRVRLAAEQASGAARRRTTLLTAMRQLQGLDPSEMGAHAVDTLRSLGFPAVELLLAGPGGLRPATSGGAGQQDLDRDEAQRAAEHAIVAGDTETASGEMIAAAVHAGATTVGAIVAASPTPGTVHPDAVDTVEVVAGHLGAAFAAQRQVVRQRELLERMGDLEAMRRAFLGQVSDELRAPLAQAREACEGLMDVDSARDAAARGRYLTLLTQRTADLRVTIDTLLDFSQTQTEAGSAEPVVAQLGEVLEATGLTLRRPADVEACHVEIDPRLFAGAIELLFGVTDVDVDVDEHHVWLTATAAEPPTRSELARSLSEQLLVGAGALLDEGPPPRVALRRVVDEVGT